MIRGAYLFISNVKDPSLDQLISKMLSTDSNHELRSLPHKVCGRITPSLCNLYIFFICCRLMLVRHREYEKKDKGWPPTPRAFDIPPETLPQNRSCNEIAVGSSWSANSVAMIRDAKRWHIDLLEEWSLATRRRPSPMAWCRRPPQIRSLWQEGT
jgi:hypothetical protein